MNEPKNKCLTCGKPTLLKDDEITKDGRMSFICHDCHDNIKFSTENQKIIRMFYHQSKMNAIEKSALISEVLAAAVKGRPSQLVKCLLEDNFLAFQDSVACINKLGTAIKENVQQTKNK